METLLTDWEAVRVGHIICLRDEQTLEYMMEQGIEGIASGANFEVVRYRRFSSQDLTSHWMLFDIEYNDIVWTLVVDVIKGDFQLAIYYEPDAFEGGNRKDLLDNGIGDILFTIDEDQDVVDFEYTPNIIEFNDEGCISASYIKQNITYGEAVEDGKKDFLTVVEYEDKNSKTENPLIMIFELNSYVTIEDVEEDADGGEITTETTDIDNENSFIQMLQGCPVRENDVEIFGPGK